MRFVAGGEIDAWCTKCRMDLLHRIVAVVAGEPKRVECETCHSQHNYRAPKGALAALAKPNAKAPRKLGAARGPRSSALSNWESHVAGKTASEFRPFSIAARFGAGDLISHVRFGQGCVTEVLGDKINVLFREGHRLLVHGRG